jgi:colanic acid biosynthesis protein WcaH
MCSVTTDKSPGFLERQDFAHVVRSTPLVSLDLIIRDNAGALLLGKRQNEPAKDYFFAPGGRIRKNETVQDAFLRLLKSETGLHTPFSAARFFGVFEHFYSTNAVGMPDTGTHYVVLAYELILDSRPVVKADNQHSELRWLDPTDLRQRDDIHDYTKA